MSMSPDGFDEELSDFDDFENPPPSAKRAKKGKASKGKGKAGNSTPTHEEGGDVASARKLQNRVAQREFRQRKLQYVKDLEARVEFLSSSKDDQLEALKALLRGLLDENKQLRAMLQTVTNFVGEGIGGLTEKVGLKGHKDIDSFMEFVHQGDRQTLLRHYDTWKEQKAAAAGNDTVNMEDVDGDDRPTTKARNSNVKDAGRRSQPSSRASSPVNATSANNQDVGLSRKRSRTEKSVSSGASKSVQPAAAQSSASAPNSNSNATGEGKQESGGSAQASPGNATTAKTGFAPSPLSGNTLNTSSTASFPSLPPNNTQPPDYATYLSLMSAAQGSGNNVSNFTNPSFYSQMGGTSTGPTYNTFANNHFGANSAASGWNNSGVRPSGAQFDNSGNVGAATGGSNPFFFDTAEPMSMPTSSFTNEFLNQFIHTGLTPLIDSSYQNTLFPWSTNNVDSQQNAATPASSSSSINQLPSPVNQNHGNMNLTNMQNQQNQQQQQQQSGFVPQLSLGQTSLQQSQQPQQQRGQQQQPSVPLQLYNPLASPSSSLPSIPPGFSPDELINSNPLLAAIHIISFHLRNKAANANYVLPPALEPTAVQASTPHDRRLDGILHREWRTRLLSKQDYDINELVADLMQAATVHPGDNLLDPANWEVSEAFMRKYKHTITPDVLADSNKWRRSRGDPEVTL